MSSLHPLDFLLTFVLFLGRGMSRQDSVENCIPLQV